jgi:hypothetical protein
MSDIGNDPADFGDSYSGEVRWCVMLQLFSVEVSGKFKEI